MDIKKIRYFISVAETLNFTKAAEENFISQSAISQHVSHMETELGFLLFNRTRNKVELTEAGIIFYNEMKIIIAKFETAIEKSRDVAKHIDMGLKIAYSEPMDMDFLSLIISDFIKKYDNQKITIEKHDFNTISSMLENDLCDIAFTYPYEIRDLKDVHTISIYSRNMFLAVSEKHPRSYCKSIDAYDIRNENIVMVDRKSGSRTYQHFMDCCKADGYEPNIVANVKDFDSFILMVEANKGVIFVSDLNENILSRKIKVLEIKNTCHTCELVAAWKKGVNHKLKQELIISIKKHIKDYKRSSSKFH